MLQFRTHLSGSANRAHHEAGRQGDGTGVPSCTRQRRRSTRPSLCSASARAIVAPSGRPTGTPIACAPCAAPLLASLRSVASCPPARSRAGGQEANSVVVHVVARAVRAASTASASLGPLRGSPYRLRIRLRVAACPPGLPTFGSAGSDTSAPRERRRARGGAVGPSPPTPSVRRGTWGTTPPARGSR